MIQRKPGAIRSKTSLQLLTMDSDAPKPKRARVSTQPPTDSAYTGVLFGVDGKQPTLPSPADSDLMSLPVAENGDNNDAAADANPSDRSRLLFIRCVHRGCLPPLELPGGEIRAPHLSTREAKLVWAEPPRRVLIVKKWRNSHVRRESVRLGLWLCTVIHVEVLMDAEATEWDQIRRLEAQWWRRRNRTRRETHLTEDKEVIPCLKPFDHDRDQGSIDLVVGIGGDGTVLHCNSLFPRAMPPVMSIAMGSLGFMTVFDCDGGSALLRRICRGVHPAEEARASAVGGDKAENGTSSAESLSNDPNWHPAAIDVALRIRLIATVHRRGQTEPAASYVVLNEVALERGTSPFMVSVEAFVDGHALTTVHADGIIVGTPTGSSAYSLSAGGSILLPTVPGILFTPICPHTLSFRPLIFPDSSVIQLVVPEDARANARATFDGRGAVDLHPGDMIEVRTHEWPLPLISRDHCISDWIHSITTKLHWNVRERQSSLHGDQWSDDSEGDASPGPCAKDHDDMGDGDRPPTHVVAAAKAPSEEDDLYE